MENLILATTLSPSELGALALMFLLAMGLLKLLTFVITKNYEQRERDKKKDSGDVCEKFENGECPLVESYSNLNQRVDDIHKLLKEDTKKKKGKK